MRKKTATPIKKEPEYPKVLETFRSIGDYELSNWKRDEPTAFNGFVQVEKYRITVEVIEEPKEVYAERLQKLWDECDNMHHWQPIKNKAALLGVAIIGDIGSKRKPR